MNCSIFFISVSNRYHNRTAECWTELCAALCVFWVLATAILLAVIIKYCNWYSEGYVHWTRESDIIKCMVRWWLCYCLNMLVWDILRHQDTFVRVQKGQRPLSANLVTQLGGCQSELRPCSATGFLYHFLKLNSDDYIDCCGSLMWTKACEGELLWHSCQPFHQK